MAPTDIGFGFTRLWGRSLREGCVSRVKDLVKHNWFVVKDPLEVEGSQHFDVGSNMTVYLDRDALFGFDTSSGNTLFTPVGVK